MIKHLAIAAAAFLSLLCTASAQLPSTGAGLAVTNGGGGIPTNALLANIGQPIYSTGTTSILVQ